MLVTFQFTTVLPCRFSQRNIDNFQWPVKHLHLHWWTCYQCYLDEKWGSDNSQCHPPADTDSDQHNNKYLPDSAHHWPISGSECRFWDIHLYSGECKGRIINDGGFRWKLILDCIVKNIWIEASCPLTLASLCVFRGGRKLVISDERGRYANDVIV